MKRTWVLLFLPLVLVAILWGTDNVLQNNLSYSVDQLAVFSFLETPYLYLYLHIFTVIPVFFLSFDKKVHYYKKWKFLFPAIFIVGVVFILWDVFFTAVGVWGFNHDYLAFDSILGLPPEEWLFFITVPFATVFIYECLKCYITKPLLVSVDKMLTIALVILFLVVGFTSWGRLYTCTTFLLTGFFLLFHFFTIKETYRGHFYIAYLISWLPFLLVNGVLTGGFTEAPIVVYNPEEYLGIRIVSVPLDDSVYSFLLLLANISIYEYLKSTNSRHLQNQ